MQIADVRRRVRERIDRAKRAAAARRARADQASREYDVFLERVAVPIFRQVANVLRAEGHPFTASTPAGSVRLTSDRSAEDHIEIVLDTTGEPQLVGRTNRGRGRRLLTSERPIAPGVEIRDVTEEDVLAYLLDELEPLVER